VEVPRDGEGRPRFSISQLRTYGAADMALLGAEAAKGCPRLYRKKYAEKALPPEPRSRHLELGSVLHDALHIMERDQVSPETALEQAWSVVLNETDWTEARQILNDYLARGGPMTRFGTLDHELDLTAQLYVDEEFGPVMFRGIIDYVGVDMDHAELLHGVDYKSNQQPPSRAQVEGDSQLKGYDWLLRQHWHRWMPKNSSPRLVMHLDALRWKDVEIRYTPQQIEDWHGWAVAVCRKILRDQEGAPHLNDGCSFCPARRDCPKWLELPETGASMEVRASQSTPDELMARRGRFAQLQKLADKEVKAIDGLLKAELNASHGVLELDGEVWRLTNGWEDDIDWPALQRLLGDRFWSVVKTSKAAIERVTDGDPALLAKARNLMKRRPSGTAIEKTKI
jgi:hypothetical protein